MQAPKPASPQAPKPASPPDPPAVEARALAALHAFEHAFAERDWEALGALLSADLLVEDHRKVGHETLLGRAAYLLALRSLVTNAPAARLFVEVLATQSASCLASVTWEGVSAPGESEPPSLIVAVVDDLERLCRLEEFDPDQRDEAEVRLAAQAQAAEEIPSPEPLISNAATRARDLWQAAVEDGDWPVVEELCASDMRFEDRRLAAQTSGDRDAFLSASRLIGTSGTAIQRTPITAAGDRLVLERVRWTGFTDGLAFETETLVVIEVDEQGHITAVIELDSSDDEAAHATLQARFDESA